MTAIELARQNRSLSEVYFQEEPLEGMEGTRHKRFATEGVR